jgi:AraC-like DNA-binding protein
VSGRTLERTFTDGTGMTLGEWRQRWRISRAIGLLAGGGNVKDVALEVGYATPSAFVAAFKKYVGTTPGRAR